MFEEEFKSTKTNESERKCPKCNKSLEKDDDWGICKNCVRKRNTNNYKKIATFILITGFIGGIILGAFFKTQTVKYDSVLDSYDYNETFNYLLMSCSWAYSFLLSLSIYAVHSICYRLDLIIDKKN